MFSCILGKVVKLSIRFFPSGVIIFCMGISCIQATPLSGFFPEPWVVPYHRFIWPLYFVLYSLFFQFSPSSHKYDIGHIKHNLYSLHYIEHFLQYTKQTNYSTFTSIWGAQEYNVELKMHTLVCGLSSNLFGKILLLQVKCK
jgi:hypothetical protein